MTPLLKSLRKEPQVRMAVNVRTQQALTVEFFKLKKLTYMRIKDATGEILSGLCLTSDFPKKDIPTEFADYLWKQSIRLAHT